MKGGGSYDRSLQGLQGGGGTSTHVASGIKGGCKYLMGKMAIDRDAYRTSVIR